MPERKPFKVAAVALANKLARIARAVMARGEAFRPLRTRTAWRTETAGNETQELAGG